MTFRASINFRATADYVTDGPGQTYSLGNAYPTSRAGLTFGWSGVFAEQDRSSASPYAPEFGGIVYGNASYGYGDFRLDLPAPGTYAVRLAIGDIYDLSYANVSCQILDGPGGDVLADVVAGAAGGGAGEYYDATGVLRTSPDDWRANNAAVPVTTTGSALVVRIADSARGGVSLTIIAHLEVAGVGRFRRMTSDGGMVDLSGGVS